MGPENIIIRLAGGYSWIARNPRQSESFGVTRRLSPSDPLMVFLACVPYLGRPLFALFSNLGRFLITAAGLAGPSH